MGRSPCCVENGLKKGPWTQEEDDKLTSYIQEHGHGSWRALPKSAGLNRCGKSCRLRWTNYLRPDIKRGKFTEEEMQKIIKLHSVLGNKWARIATHLPGRTDNEIKNYWNTHIRKKLLQMGIDPITHRPRNDLSLFANLTQMLALPIMNSITSTPPIMNNNSYDQIKALRQHSDATEIAKLHVLQNLIQILHTTPNPSTHGPDTILGSLSSQSNINNTKFPYTMNSTMIFDAVVPSSSASASAPTRSDVIQYGICDTWGGFGGKDIAQEVMGKNNYEHGSRSIGLEALPENKLPNLVYSGQDLTKSNHGSVESIQDHDFFDGLENLIDDGSSEGFLWKDLLN